MSDESQWRVWLPRIVVAGSPFLLAAISVTAAQFSLHGDLPLSARNSILLANLVVAVAASIAGGLFCRDRLWDRIGDMFGGGVYAFVAYWIIVMLAIRVIE